MISSQNRQDPPAQFEVKGNTVEDNRGECGLGIGLFGARNIEVAANNVSGNITNGRDPSSGGVVVAGNGEGIAPKNNTVVANNFGRNRPDIREGDGYWQRLRSEQLQHERAGPLVRLKAFRFVEEGPRRRGPSSSSVPSRPDCAVLPYTHQRAGLGPIHRRAWKVNSANFVMTEFSEVYFPGGAAMAVRAYRGSRARDWGAPRAA